MGEHTQGVVRRCRCKVLSTVCCVAAGGVGIPAGEESRMFKIFSQVDTSATRKYGGIGLGLVIVKKICHVLLGNVSYKPASIKGAIFSIWVPAKVVFENQSVRIIDNI